MARLYANNAKSTLASNITNSATSLSVQTGDGAKFPNPSSPDYFWVTLDDGTNIEIVQCTARSTDTLTIVRGQDGTSGTAFNSGTKVALRWTKDSAKNMHQKDMADQEWTGQTADSSATPSGFNAHVLVRKFSGRPLLYTKPGDTWPTPYQPGLFTSNIFLVTPNTSTTINVTGGSLTSVGTVSHQTPTISTGIYTRFASGSSTNSTAGTGSALLQWARGNTTGQVNGFFYSADIIFESAAGSGATGTRFFAGLTDQTLASTTGADDPGGNHCGFTYSTNAGDTNFQFSTKDNTTNTKSNTSMAWAQSKIFRFLIYCAPQGATIYWRVDNLTDSTTQEGSKATNLPSATALLRGGFQLQILTTGAKNIGMKHLYIETNF